MTLHLKRSRRARRGEMRESLIPRQDRCRGRQVTWGCPWLQKQAGTFNSMGCPTPKAFVTHNCDVFGSMI